MHKILIGARSLFVLLCACFIVAYSATVNAGNPQLKAVAASYGSGGAPVNGISLGSTMTLPTINDSGEVGFRAEEYLLNEGYYVPGVWMVSSAGEIRKVAYKGMPAVGVEPRTFEGYSTLSSHAEGQSAFIGIFPEVPNDYNPFTLESGLWAIDEQGDMRLVARFGQEAVGTNESFNWPFDSSYFNNLHFRTSNLGQVAFSAQVGDPNEPVYYNRGIWAEDENLQLQLIARDNQPVAGMSDGTTFRSIYGNTFVLSEQGRVGFQAITSGSDANDPWKLGIWQQSEDSTLRAIVSAGDPLPALNSTRYLFDVENFDMNNRGDVAFLALSLQSKQAPIVDTQRGIWLTRSTGDTHLVAIGGAPAPGLDETWFGNFDSNVYDKTILLNGSGDVAFTASLQGPHITSDNDTSLWLRRANGDLRLVAQEGSQAPNGSAFQEFSPLTTSMSLAEAGQVIFNNSIDEIWGFNSKEQLILIAELGQQIDVDNGPGVDLRTLESIGFLGGSGGEDGVRSGVNDRGQVVFFSRLGRFNGGIFLSNALVVPEPLSISVAGGLLLLSLLSRRTRMI